MAQPTGALHHEAIRTHARARRNQFIEVREGVYDYAPTTGVAGERWATASSGRAVQFALYNISGITLAHVESDSLGSDGQTNAQRTARWEAIEASLAPVRPSVVPLYGPRKKRVPYHGGCGVLIRLAERLFVFTASHVHLGLEENTVGEVLIATATAFVPVVGLCYRTNSSGSQPDSVDAAVFELRETDGLESLRVIAHPLSPSTVFMKPDPNADIVTLGFPHRDATRTEGRKVVPLRYIWEGPRLEEEHYGAIGLRPDHHVTMQLDLAEVVNDVGATRRSLSPAGVSGSGMWSWLPGQTARLERIFTDARDACFIGTQIGAHLMLVRKYNPQAFAEWMP